MKTGTIVLILIGVLILLLGGCTYNAYNGLVRSDQEVQNAWSNVETNYQRRTDLYNSVIKVVEGSANFEKSTLTDVIAARAKATSITVNVNDQKSLQQFQEAQNQFQGTFSKLMAVAEAYPNLKTTQAFQDFQVQIEGTENRINIARQDYNKTVNTYNLRVKSFPGNVFAGMFGYSAKPYFQAKQGSENPPDINFNIK
jgi:LemA protein